MQKEKLFLDPVAGSSTVGYCCGRFAALSFDGRHRHPRFRTPSSSVNVNGRHTHRKRTFFGSPLSLCLSHEQQKKAVPKEMSTHILVANLLISL